MCSSVVEYVALHASEQPDKLCLVDVSCHVTYREMWERVAGCARALSDLGVAQGDCVTISCSQNVEFMIAMLGVQLVGAIAVPIEKNAMDARCAEIVSQVSPALHVGKRFSSDVPCQSSCVDAESLCGRRVAVTLDSDAFPTKEADAEILFSTGTTGKAKGIVLTHRNNVAVAENIINATQMKSDNIEVIPMPLSHSHGLRSLYANLVNGSSVIIVDGVLAVKSMFDLMDTYGATSVDLSVSMLLAVLKLSGNRLASYGDALDYMELGTAPISEQDKRGLIDMLPNTRLYLFYGTTEAGRTCSLCFSELTDKPHCIGEPTVNARFVVVDENRVPIESSADNLGYLASSGDANMRCYLGAPELTRETMSGGLIYSDDLGYIGDDGLLYVVGRKGDVINYGGIQIAPEEIERIAVDCPVVKDCACVHEPDDLMGQVPVLCVVPDDGALYDEGTIWAFLRERLDAARQPGRICVVDEIPRTFNGKIIRRKLIEQLNGARASND